MRAPYPFTWAQLALVGGVTLAALGFAQASDPQGSPTPSSTTTTSAPVVEDVLPAECPTVIEVRTPREVTTYLIPCAVQP